MLKLPVKSPIVNGDIDLSEYAKKSDVDAIDASLDNKADKKEVEKISSQLDNSNAEVAAARNGFETLGKRLDGVDSQLDTIETKLQFVTYDMFNPKCDGICDDGIQIKACHDYANEHNIPVINTGGK